MDSEGPVGVLGESQAAWHAFAQGGATLVTEQPQSEPLVAEAAALIDLDDDHSPAAQQRTAQSRSTGTARVKVAEVFELDQPAGCVVAAPAHKTHLRISHGVAAWDAKTQPSLLD